MRCEAILCCKIPAGQVVRCEENACADFNGHAVCWVHDKAANNPERAEPLQFKFSRASKAVP